MIPITTVDANTCGPGVEELEPVTDHSDDVTDHSDDATAP